MNKRHRKNTEVCQEYMKKSSCTRKQVEGRRSLPQIIVVKEMASRPVTLRAPRSLFYTSVYMYHSFLIHSSADGHLGCFHVLAMINSAAMNIGVHVYLSDLVSSVCIPRSGIAGSYGSSISSFFIILIYICVCVCVCVCILYSSFPFHFMYVSQDFSLCPDQ